MTKDELIALAEARRTFVEGCLQFALDMIGEGYIVPEDLFYNYSVQAGDDEDWETFPKRIAHATTLGD